MRLGIDASNWRNQRGLGRYLRCITQHLCFQPGLQVTLFSPHDLTAVKMGTGTPVSDRACRENGDAQGRAPTQTRVCPPSRARAPRPLSERRDDGPHFHIPDNCELHWDSRRLPWLSWRLPTLARKHPVDLMLFPTNDVWWRGPVPYAVTIHDLACLHFADRIFRSRWEAWLEAARIKRAARHAVRVITPSEATRLDIIQTLGCGPEKIAVILEGVSDPFNSEPTLSLDHVRSKFSLPDTPYILYTGGLDFRKNVPALIAAFAQLAQEGFEHTLILVGEYGANRRYYPDIDTHIRETGLGDRLQRLAGVSDSELHTLYANADLFVFPSLFEGFGLPPLEAMACGTPVVCSNAASLPEVVGDAAELFDGKDLSALIGAMRRVLGNVAWAAELRQRGLARAKLFTWDRTAQGMLDVLLQPRSGAMIP